VGGPSIGAAHKGLKVGPPGPIASAAYGWLQGEMEMEKNEGQRGKRGRREGRVGPYTPPIFDMWLCL